ncbi:RrF2 family transcriptional regulator [Rhodococcus chondri]|uniref:Rrf2 family transcriptional regulator n=1 Tax=Rhodococcus chondri TaxID=3065941 RepID=A0ABU7JYI7_9NOCA|nr:Rrf2 family transcriptional regulator [Rhodococcus sp. CC-R104]MEE2034347.1 Rrf2 family transcriptional regulator [Rhodococcus sp. CC-R104]
MQLTQFTDLGLRVVTHLAAAPTDSVPSTKSVAEQLNLSYAHTTKVVARLSELGVVTTRRGRGGGLTITELGRSATIGWLARQLEGEGEVVECEGTKPCPLRQACSLRSALRNAQEAFYRSLDTATVADLIQPRTSRNEPVLLTLTPSAV